MKKPITLIIALLWTVLSASVTAQDANYDQFGIDTSNTPEGLQVGETVRTFRAETSTGELFDLGKALEKGLVAVIFYRGSWCPYCTEAMAAYTDSLLYLSDAGITLVAITPESDEHIAETQEKSGSEIAIIEDANGSLMHAFKVDFKVNELYLNKLDKYNIDLYAHNSSDEAALPIPATYLIKADPASRNGVIAWRYFNPNYRERATVKSILDAAGDVQ